MMSYKIPHRPFRVKFGVDVVVVTPARAHGLSQRVRVAAAPTADPLADHFQHIRHAAVGKQKYNSIK